MWFVTHGCLFGWFCFVVGWLCAFAGSFVVGDWFGCYICWVLAVGAVLVLAYFRLAAGWCWLAVLLLWLLVWMLCGDFCVGVGC